MSPTAPNSWLAPAVLVTLCCFPPTGVAAIYFAARVGVLWELGEDQAAQLSAKRAKTLCLLSLALWVLATLVLAGTGRMGRLLESGAL